MQIINSNSIIGRFILKNKISFENNIDFMILLIERLRKYKIKEYYIKNILSDFLKNNYLNYIDTNKVYVIHFDEKYKIYYNLFKLSNNSLNLYINIPSYFIKKRYLNRFQKERSKFFGLILDKYDYINEKIDNFKLKILNKNIIKSK